MTPLRVAVVGSGPAGAYAAGHLVDHGDTIEVEMVDRLPTPWGLVRAGVAPDHQRTKGVTRMFEWTASAPGFGFHLNVEIGRDISHDELLAHHHAVIYAVGAPDHRHLGIPGEDLPGSHAATEFVAWYNGHPEYRRFLRSFGRTRRNRRQWQRRTRRRPDPHHAGRSVAPHGHRRPRLGGG